jgi:hypothetical protein
MPPPRLTDSLEQEIISYIRAGSYPEGAAETAGVPLEVFRDWLARGEAPRAQRYRAFVHAIRKALAFARVGAEVTVRTDRPLDWLRYGPGRETADRPGWTASVRPRTTHDSSPSPLTDPRAQAVFTQLLTALDPFPDARAAAAAQMEKNGAHCLPFPS